MSLINQVLKDLEQRHAGEVRGAARAVRPLPEDASRRTMWIVLGLLLPVAAGGAAWWYLSPSPVPVSPAQVGGVGATPVKTAVAALPAPMPTLEVPPSASAATLPDPLPLAPAAVPPAPTPGKRATANAESSAPAEPMTQEISGLPQPKFPRPAVATLAPTPAAVPARARLAEPAAAVPVEMAQPTAPQPANPKPAGEALRKAKGKVSGPNAAARAEPAEVQGPEGAEADGAEPTPNIEKQARPPSDRERAEADFREAMAMLSAGHAAEAEDKLRAALAIDPLADKARQALLGLYIERGRREDAERLLEDRLGVDRRQAGFALALARLQLERGANGDALTTLEGSLRYGELSADYQAMLANALGRLGRHREAAERYGAAAGLAPRNPVWLMGLGVELRADNHPGDARAAFLRARELGGLNPQLASFVDQQLKELK